MKRWQKIVLVIVFLILVSQLPFIYRRYRLRKLQAAISSLQSQRKQITSPDGVTEVRGVVHVHSFLGGHSTGTFQSLIAAARANGLDFVLMSEHPAREFDTGAMTLQGMHGGILFVSGNEVSTSNGDRLLHFPADLKTTEIDERMEQENPGESPGSLEVVAYPEEFKSWDSMSYQGIEIYNVFTNAKKINALSMFFDGLWSYRAYPDLLFARFYTRPNASLQKWDEVLLQKRQPIAAFAGNDAHANVGFSLTDSSGNRWLGMQLDPYERSFRLVRMHVLLSPNETLKQETLLAALRRGHSFIGFDIFSDSSGFRFTGADADEQKMMGDEISLSGDVGLSVRAPLTGRIQLLRDGVVVADSQNTDRLDLVVRERGIYRAEVYLPQLPEIGSQPWIISNPIYVR